LTTALATHVCEAADEDAVAVYTRYSRPVFAARIDLVCELGTRLLMHGAKAKHVSNVRLARVLGWRWAGRWECVEMVR
jgi:hypothetical protein